MKALAFLLLTLVVLSGCAAPAGKWVALPDPQDGKVYPCCYYPHGYQVWVEDGKQGPSYLRGPWIGDLQRAAVEQEIEYYRHFGTDLRKN